MFGANKNSDIWHSSWEAEIKIANVELRPNYIRESQLAKRGITRTRSTCRRLTQGQQSEWEGREESSTASCMRQNSSNSLQMPTWDSKDTEEEVYTLMEYDGRAVQTLSHNWKYHFAMNQNSELNTTQRHHRESDDKYASGNRET